MWHLASIENLGGHPSTRMTLFHHGSVALWLQFKALVVVCAPDKHCGGGICYFLLRKLKKKVQGSPPQSVNKAAHFETERVHHQKSKAGVSYKKEMCPPKIKIKVLIKSTVEKVPSFRSNETGEIETQETDSKQQMVLVEAVKWLTLWLYE